MPPKDAAEIALMLETLSPDQLDVVHSIVERFAGGFEGEHLRDDFISADAYAYFGARLTAHHAYSSKMLKKENFEHILEQSFRLAGIEAHMHTSRTHRGADIVVDGVQISLKTEAAKDLKPGFMTISKLMEGVWIKTVTSREDVVAGIHRNVLPHFDGYERIFILRSFLDPVRDGHVRYDLHEIPKSLFLAIGDLVAEDFSPLTEKRTTGAEVRVGGRVALKFRLDGSDDKLTVTNLAVPMCPMHAWWSLRGNV